MYTADYDRQKEIIRQHRMQLKTIMEKISDALFMIDCKGNLTWLNHTARELFQPLNSFINNSGNYFEKADLFDLNDMEVAFENNPKQMVMRGESFTELQFLAKLEHGNYYVSISGSPVFDENGNFQMGILICRDITGYMKSSKSPGVQKSQLEAIMDNVSEVILILDTTGKIHYANKAIRRYYEIMNTEKVEEIYSKTIMMDYERNVLTSEDLPYRRVMKTKEIFRTSLIAQIDGVDLYLDIAAIPVLDENGNIVFIMVSINDVTEHIKNEMLMREKNEMLEQALQLKDEFFSLISHEFKTPLTVINSAVQAMELLCGDELSEKAKGFINKIRQNSYRQIRLVNNLLDITRINAGHLKVNRKNSDIIFLTRAITESVQLYAGQKDLDLRFMATRKQKIISLDDEKYERILLNLLSNAIKFSPKGNVIKVRVHFAEGRVLIDVSDKGIGIPADKLEIIFKRFGQVDSSLSRQAEGTGLGLSLVKLFVEALNGSISVKSSVGSGSTFTISLPDIIAEENIEETMKEFTDNRIIKAANIEFSDIYI